MVLTSGDYYYNLFSCEISDWLIGWKTLNPSACEISDSLIGEEITNSFYTKCFCEFFYCYIGWKLTNRFLFSLTRHTHTRIAENILNPFYITSWNYFVAPLSPSSCFFNLICFKTVRAWRIAQLIKQIYLELILFSTKQNDLYEKRSKFLFYNPRKF